MDARVKFTTGPAKGRTRLPGNDNDVNGYSVTIFAALRTPCASA
jgi:hypothetical protein